MQAINTSPWFQELLADHQPPCISVYMPVARSAPHATADPVLFGELLEKAQKQLLGIYDKRRAEPLIQRLRDATADADFWSGQRDGLAFFCSADYFQVLDLQRTIDPHVEVADTFHIKPLIRLMQSADRYQVLCLSPKNVKLYEGDEHRLDPIEPLRGVPRSTRETLDSASGPAPVRAADDQKDMRRGVPATDPNLISAERFFRAVDQGVWENYSRKYQLPLILCADASNYNDFRNWSKNPFLLEEGIVLQPDNLLPQRLREEAWKLIAPRYRDQVRKLGDQFQAAKARQLGSDQLMQVAEAVAQGRVGTLLVETDRHVPGRLLRHSGLIEQAKLEDPRVDDVLDDLAEMVLKMDGQVYVVPPEQMPTDQGIAATYRY